MNQPVVNVGIMSVPELQFIFNGSYKVNGAEVTDSQTAVIADGMIEWLGDRYTELLFEPVSDNCNFTLTDVTIGVNFHW